MSHLTQRELPSSVRHNWTVNDFERLFDAGFFPLDARLELVEGEIWKKMTQNEPHAVALSLAEFALGGIFANCYVRTQQPMILGETSKPEPDLAVVIGVPRDYLASHPSTAELVVEISHATLIPDQKTKAALYARAQIAEYWIVNLVDRTLEVRRQPSPLEGELLGHGYRLTQILLPGESIAPLGAPDSLVGVDELLP